MPYKRRAEEMSSLNASSVAKCQQWRNDLLNSSLNAPLNLHEILNEPVQRKYLAQQGLLEQFEQQAQQGQLGPHGQAGQHGQHSQMGQLPGQQGFSGQQSLSGQQSVSGQNGHSGQNGLSGQNGFSGQNRFSGQNDFGGQNGLPGRSGFSVLNGLSGQNGNSAQNAFSGQNGLLSQNSLSGQQGISGQQGLLCQHGQPLTVSQPGQPGAQTQAGQPGQILALAPTVCCDQANCERATIEQLPEQYFQEPDYIYVSATPFTLMNPADGCDPQAGKKDPSEQYMFCPCGMSRGQFITICCTGKDCDNSTKIDEVPMGPPEEKRAKTTLNQNQYKY